ncbi:MAG: 50S ribosomal protein L10 [Proteobacteria bacterium]|jgi:large subunit ribosomal protein L10|nr:50S ribosomal protein L10 [Alphaproteobacteria bacterium]NCC03017.1 50S ribosomal protein L10 [Pseudomonadota bacterium]
MSENRKVKEGKVASYGEDMKAAGLIVIAEQCGLNADETLELRRSTRAEQVALKVMKNTLAKLALNEIGLSGLDSYMKGPTILAYSKDPVTAAKVVAEFAKKNQKIKILGAAMGSQILDAKGAMALASLPSLNELRGKLVGLLQAPATKIAGVTQAPAGQLARVLSARSKQAA